MGRATLVTLLILVVCGCPTGQTSSSSGSREDNERGVRSSGAGTSSGGESSGTGLTSSSGGGSTGGTASTTSSGGGSSGIPDPGFWVGGLGQECVHNIEYPEGMEEYEKHGTCVQGICIANPLRPPGFGHCRCVGSVPSRPGCRWDDDCCTGSCVDGNCVERERGAPCGEASCDAPYCLPGGRCLNAFGQHGDPCINTSECGGRSCNTGPECGITWCFDGICRADCGSSPDALTCDPTWWRCCAVDENYQRLVCADPNGDTCTTCMPMGSECGQTTTWPERPCCNGVCTQVGTYRYGENAGRPHKLCMDVCSPEHLPCRDDEDCCIGTCVSGRCHDPCRPGGAECGAGVQCCSGTCEAGVCAAPCAEACSSEVVTVDGVRQGTRCGDGECQTCPMTGSACEPGQVCCNGAACARYCDVHPNGNGCSCLFSPCDPCELNPGSPACTTWECPDVCLSEQVGGPDCGCVEAGGRCRLSNSNGATDQDSACCSGSCVDGICAASSPPGSVCSAGKECASGLCGAGGCACTPTFEACVTDIECCSGKCLGGRCELGEAGEPCRRNDDCMSQLCTNGVCDVVPLGSFCREVTGARTVEPQVCEGAIECPPYSGPSLQTPDHACTNVCFESRCCQVEGEACSDGRHCCSTHCEAGLCKPIPAQMSSCDYGVPHACPNGRDDECCPGDVCFIGTHQCIDPNPPAGSSSGSSGTGCRGTNSLCGQGADCCSGICCAGYCATQCDNSQSSCVDMSTCIDGSVTFPDGPGHCENEMVGHFTNTCTNTIDCVICPTGAPSSACGSSTFTSGETEAGELSGWWWCDAGDSVLIRCGPAGSPPECLGL